MQKPLIAVLLASAFSLNAQAADLIQVYQQALANDASYASARASAAAGRERITQGRSGLLPTVGVSGDITKSNNDFTSWNGISGPGTGLRSNQIQVTLQQPLFHWDRWETYQQSKLA